MAFSRALQYRVLRRTEGSLMNLAAVAIISKDDDRGSSCYTCLSSPASSSASEQWLTLLLDLTLKISKFWFLSCYCY